MISKMVKCKRCKNITADAIAGLCRRCAIIRLKSKRDPNTPEDVEAAISLMWPDMPERDKEIMSNLMAQAYAGELPRGTE